MYLGCPLTTTAPPRSERTDITKGTWGTRQKKEGGTVCDHPLPNVNRKNKTQLNIVRVVRFLISYRTFFSSYPIYQLHPSSLARSLSQFRSTIGSHTGRSSPLPVTVRAFKFSSREEFSSFFHRRLASTCASTRKVQVNLCTSKKDRSVGLELAKSALVQGSSFEKELSFSLCCKLLYCKNQDINSLAGFVQRCAE